MLLHLQMAVQQSQRALQMLRRENEHLTSVMVQRGGEAGAAVVP